LASISREVVVILSSLISAYTQIVSAT